jgi:hypothetical protein
MNRLLDFQLRSGLGASPLVRVWETVNEKRWHIQTKPSERFTERSRQSRTDRPERGTIAKVLARSSTAILYFLSYSSSKFSAA